MATTPVRVLRVIARMNVGGPAVEVSELIRRLPRLGFDQRLLVGSCGEDEADFLESQAQDISAIRIPDLGRAIRPWRDIRVVFAVRKEILAYRPQLVHTHTAKAGVVGRIAALTVTPRPRLVHTFHGHVLQGYFSARTNMVYRLIELTLGRFTDALVAVGPEIRQELLAQGIGRADRFVVIEPGVSLRHAPSAADARRSLGIPPEAFVICVVGRITHIKRPDRMLDVIRAIKGHLGNLQVIVAGSGDLSHEVASAVHAESLPVQLLGWVDDVETIFAASDVALLTSDNEGTPISLIQAGLLGVPAVATAVGSVGHVVINGTTGILRAPDSLALAQAILELAAEPARRRAMGEAARDHLQDTYSVERFIKRHAALYRSVLGIDAKLIALQEPNEGSHDPVS